MAENMTVENGNGIKDANSYVDIEYADAYFSARNITQWAEKTDEEKEVLLIKATDYIDNVFEWYGKKEFTEQSLRFPRKNLYDYEGEQIKGIPKSLKDAVCETINVLLSDTELYKTESENGFVTSEKIGQLSFTYDVSQKIKNSTLYESINYRLRGLYKDSTSNRIFSMNIKRV